MQTTFSRRSFLQAVGAIGTTPVWSRLASLSAYAATATSTAAGYKAAVCVALRGGNDANNMVIPYTPESYSRYAQARSTLALPYGLLLPLGTDAALGLHPTMRNLQTLYNRGAASIVTGVGALRAPVTKATIQAGAANIPELFSHPTSQSEWESGSVDAHGSLGWGGRMLDALSTRAGRLPGVISLAGNSLFLIGQSNAGFTIAQSSDFLPAVPTASVDVAARLATIDASSPLDLVRISAGRRSGMLTNQQIIADSLRSGRPLETAFPSTSLGSNLKTIAQLIAGRDVVGSDRQMFFCQQGGFDTHIDQLGLQNDIFVQLDSAIGAFYTALTEMGLQNNVLLFTISDFSRTYQSNTGGGSDHGWAGHQLVVGGGISGARALGTFPSGMINGPDDLNGLGVWIPSTSSVQMAAGVAQWMGVSQTDVTQIFPDLRNFPTGALAF